MGVCCAKLRKVDQNEVVEKTVKHSTHEAPGLTGNVRSIQRAWRRHKTLLSKSKFSQAPVVPAQSDPTTTLADPTGHKPTDLGSMNERVTAVEKQLGPFLLLQPSKPNAEREKRPPTVIDNGATYAGEWYD